MRTHPINLDLSTLEGRRRAAEAANILADHGVINPEDREEQLARIQMAHEEEQAEHTGAEITFCF